MLRRNTETLTKMRGWTRTTKCREQLPYNRALHYLFTQIQEFHQEECDRYLFSYKRHKGDRQKAMIHCSSQYRKMEKVAHTNPAQEAGSYMGSDANAEVYKH